MLGACTQKRVAIACGGTGGHLFPGLAVACECARRNLGVTLLVSPKDVDQRAVRAALGLSGVSVVTLPAAAFQSGSRLAFIRGLARSYRVALTAFRDAPPAAVLAMGGFTSVAPVLAGRRACARVFLHESNVVPGRANRLIAWCADEAFLGFAEAAVQLCCRKKTVTGTPVRPEIVRRDPRECRIALGLDPAKPTVLVMGGSQGASAINDLVTALVQRFRSGFSGVQWIHLTGPSDIEKVQAIYAQAGVQFMATAFCDKMHLALGAATVAISRAGASALAELAAVQLPAILIPYPRAAGNHQLHNARAFERAGAAIVLEQYRTEPEFAAQLAEIARNIKVIIEDAGLRQKMQVALAGLHRPNAARDIADAITAAVLPNEQLRGECAVATSAAQSRHLSVVP
jgi:UDP-N-acetylglucosamine--N-acetylmuramyl-(pentapeptide) pyrophosphoryl-undecaprenol N-acetylglucosamine transferase